MGKIGGGFWPFLAGKRAGSDSEVLATLLKFVNKHRQRHFAQSAVEVDFNFYKSFWMFKD